MARAFVPAYPWKNWSKIDLYHYRSVCHYYREVRNSDHSPSWQFGCPSSLVSDPKWRLVDKRVFRQLTWVGRESDVPRVPVCCVGGTGTEFFRCVSFSNRSAVLHCSPNQTKIRASKCPACTTRLKLLQFGNKHWRIQRKICNQIFDLGAPVVYSDVARSLIFFIIIIYTVSSPERL